MKVLVGILIVLMSVSISVNANALNKQQLDEMTEIIIDLDLERKVTSKDLSFTCSLWVKTAAQATLLRQVGSDISSAKKYMNEYAQYLAGDNKKMQKIIEDMGLKALDSAYQEPIGKSYSEKKKNVSSFVGQYFSSCL